VEHSQFVILSAPGMHGMAQSVCDKIKAKYGVDFPHHEISLDVFKSGEILPRIPETVRRQHVFLFFPLQLPDPNFALIACYLTCDALMRAHVGGITLVIPNAVYMRQDRKNEKREPISARAIADLLTMNPKVEGIIATDLHTQQAEGFFRCGVDNLTSRQLFAKHYQELLGPDLSDVVVVAPDFGDAARADAFAKRLGEDVPVTIFRKNRPAANQSEVIGYMGVDVRDKRIILYDDMIDSGGTVRGVMEKLVTDLGATEVHVCATHGIFSDGAEEAFRSLGHPVACTDSIPRTSEYLEANASWLTVLSFDELLASAVYEASLMGGSVSKLSK